MAICVLGDMIQRGTKNPNLDKQILSELDDLEMFSGRVYILKETEYWTGKLWWKKRQYLYCLYLEMTEGCEYQILTSTEGDGSQVLSFLFGANSSHERRKGDNEDKFQLPEKVRFWDSIYTLNFHRTEASKDEIKVFYDSPPSKD